MFVASNVVCCVDGDLCDELITHSEEYYQACVSVCDLETSTMRWPRPKSGCCATEKNIFQPINHFH